MKKSNLMVLSTFLFALAASPGLWAALPSTLNYQGRIATSTGPVPDSTGNTVIFRIFNALSAGTEMWAEEYSSLTTTTRFVATKSGLFNVQLGQFNPISLPFDVPYFLQVEWYNATTPGYEIMAPRQPLAMAPYTYRAKYLDAPLDLTSSTLATTVFANNTAGGMGLLGSGQVGVLGSGQTGTAGTASIPGGIGVVASDGAQAGALALRAQGKSVFEQNVTFTPGTSVFFNGVNVQGMSVSPVVPMSLVGPVGIGGGALSVTNTGTGYGVIAAVTSPGFAAGPIDNTQKLTAGIYGYSSSTLSAGVMGINSNSVNNQDAGVIGLAYYQGVIGNAYGATNTAIGGSFDGGSLGMGVVARGVTGVSASGSAGGTAILAQQNSGNYALMTFGNSLFSGGGGYKSVFQQDVTFGAGTNVYFNGANVQGLSNIAPPLNLSGNIGSPIIHGSDFGNNIGVQGTSVGGTGIYGDGGTYGLYGNSGSTGVYGNGGSTGVYAFSSVGNGVVAYSNSNSAIYAQTFGGGAPTIYASNSAGADSIQAFTNGSGSEDAIYGDDQGWGSGVHGISANGVGVYGESDGSSEGVFGDAVNGTGVYGQSTFGLGGQFYGFDGVQASTWASGGTGIEGQSNDSSGTSNQYGVRGEAASGPGGIGVYGSGSLYSIQGDALYASTIPIFGSNWNSFNSNPSVYGFNPGFNNSGSGVEGYNTSPNGVGVLAQNDGGGDGIRASTVGGAGGADAIYGEDDGPSSTGSGVYGYSTSGYGVYGIGGTGVYADGVNYGVTAYGGSYGIYANGKSGIYANSSAANGYGVLAENTSNSADNNNFGAALWLKGRLAISPSGGNSSYQNDNASLTTYTLPVPQSSCRINIATSKPSSTTYTVTVGSGGNLINTTTMAIVTIYAMSPGYTYSVTTTFDTFIVHFSPAYAFTGAEYLNFMLINQQ